MRDTGKAISTAQLAIGGTPGVGTLFEITAAGVESLLHNFKGRPGDWYGPLRQSDSIPVASSMGPPWLGAPRTVNCNDENSGCGTVYEFITSSGTEKVLYTFLGGSGWVSSIRGGFGTGHQGQSLWHNYVGRRLGLLRFRAAARFFTGDFKGRGDGALSLHGRG